MKKWASIFLALSLVFAGCSDNPKNPEKDKEQAESVATTFAKEVLDLKDRKSDTDIQGLDHATHWVQTKIKEEFGNYQDLIERFQGTQRFPEVQKITIQETFPYQSSDKKANGYIVNMKVFYNPDRHISYAKMGLLLIEKDGEWLVDRAAFSYLPKDTK